MYDKFRYRLVDERQIGANQTTSRTSLVTIYPIPARHIARKVYKGRCCINVIDTPGFGDTRGMVWDAKIAQMLEKLLGSFNALDYLLMVTKSTENRLTASSQFVYAKLQNLFGADLNER